MWLRWLPAFAISIQRCRIHWFYIKVGFSLGNLLSNSSLAKMWLSTRNRIFSSTSIDTTLMVQVLPNRKSLDFDYLKSRQMRWYTPIQNSQMNLASGAGSPGWARTRPKLVCCEAIRLRSKEIVMLRHILLIVTYFKPWLIYLRVLRLTVTFIS